MEAQWKNGNWSQDLPLISPFHHFGSPPGNAPGPSRIGVGASPNSASGEARLPTHNGLHIQRRLQSLAGWASLSRFLMLRGAANHATDQRRGNEYGAKPYVT